MIREKSKLRNQKVFSIDVTKSLTIYYTYNVPFVVLITRRDKSRVAFVAPGAVGAHRKMLVRVLHAELVDVRLVSSDCVDDMIALLKNSFESLITDDVVDELLAISGDKLSQSLL